MAAVLSSQALHTNILMSADEYIQPRRPVLAHVQAAGDASKANADCTASCLTFDERPQTPDHQKKYRQSVLHEPGKIVRHFGVAEDPIQEGCFGRATIARPGESVADYIRSYPQSSLAQWALQRSEDVYASSKREPLGRGYVRGHHIPEALGAAVPFGVAVHAKELDRAGQAKAAMFPQANPIGSSRDPQDPSHHLYVTSHGAYGAGEQRHRHYDWDRTGLDPATHSFGLPSGCDQQHGLKQALQPGQSPEASSATLCDQHWAQFQLTNRDELGQVKRLGMAGRELGQDHIFGVPSKHEAGSVSSLLKGDYSPEQLQDDADLGKSVKEGWRNLGPAGRIYGVPTVRHDIKAPKKQSIANAQNYGNEPNSRQLIHPAAMVDRGINEQHFLQQMPKDAIRELMADSGINLEAGMFDAIFQHAALLDKSSDTCSLGSFMQSRQSSMQPQAHHGGPETQVHSCLRGLFTMPRTYGEVCPSSFSDLLALGGDNKVLVDCGSGHGSLVKAAVEQFGCIFAIGIEKYKEPAAIAAKLFTSSCGDLQAKMRFLLEDMNDSDIPQQLQGLSFSTLILFCNNLAFHEGTVHRSSIAFREVMASFPDKSVFVVSTRAMKLLDSHFIKTLPLKMSWSEDLQDVFVYASGMPN